MTKKRSSNSSQMSIGLWKCMVRGCKKWRKKIDLTPDTYKSSNSFLFQFYLFHSHFLQKLPVQGSLEFRRLFYLSSSSCRSQSRWSWRDPPCPPWCSPAWDLCTRSRDCGDTRDSGELRRGKTCKCSPRILLRKDFFDDSTTWRAPDLGHTPSWCRDGFWSGNVPRTWRWTGTWWTPRFFSRWDNDQNVPFSLWQLSPRTSWQFCDQSLLCESNKLCQNFQFQPNLSRLSWTDQSVDKTDMETLPGADFFLDTAISKFLPCSRILTS